MARSPSLVTARTGIVKPGPFDDFGVSVGRAGGQGRGRSSRSRPRRPMRTERSCAGSGLRRPTSRPRRVTLTAAEGEHGAEPAAAETEAAAPAGGGRRRALDGPRDRRPGPRRAGAASRNRGAANRSGGARRRSADRWRPACGCLPARRTSCFEGLPGYSFEPQLHRGRRPAGCHYVDEGAGASRSRRSPRHGPCSSGDRRRRESRARARSMPWQWWKPDARKGSPQLRSSP